MIDISSILQIPSVQTPLPSLPDPASFEAVWVNVQNAPPVVEPTPVVNSVNTQKVIKTTSDPSVTSAIFAALSTKGADTENDESDVECHNDIMAPTDLAPTEFAVPNFVPVIASPKAGPALRAPIQHAIAAVVETPTLAGKATPEKVPASAPTDANAVPSKVITVEVGSSQTPNFRLENSRATTPQSSPAQPIPVAPHQLDLARDMMWLDNLAREIVASASREGRIGFRLVPESLGQLDVGITHIADGVHIQLDASTDAAAQIIAVEQPRLIDELRQSGVKVSSSELLGGQQHGSPKGQSALRQEPTIPSAAEHKFQNNPNPKRNGRFA